MLPPFDPSKMDPKLLMELSQVVRQLPPDQLNRMQTLMHNMMAGYDVSREMEEFEKTLPPGFREKIVRIVGTAGGPGAFGAGVPFGLNSGDAQNAAHPGASQAPGELPGSVKEARLTVLRAVAAGSIEPDNALDLLFPTG
jgi:hypothetical protein